MTALEIILIVLIILFVGAIIGWRVYKYIRKKQGKASQGGGCCDCAGCAHSGSCPSAKQATDYGRDIDEQMPEINVRSDVTCDFSDLVKRAEPDVKPENNAKKSSK